METQLRGISRRGRAISIRAPTQRLNINYQVTSKHLVGVNQKKMRMQERIVSRSDSKETTRLLQPEPDRGRQMSDGVSHYNRALESLWRRGTDFRAS